MPQTDRIIARKQDRIGLIVFNNPERHNAMSLEMWQETHNVLAHFADDDEVRVVVLTGAGQKAFVSGADISKFDDERASRDAADKYNEATGRTFEGLSGFKKPTIAMIRGYCIGGGLALALCCDLRICTPDSKFAIPAAKLGIGYDHRGVKQLIDIVGPAFAKEIFFTARQFDAEEARIMGLVNRIVPDGDLETYVKTYAETIGANAPLTVLSIKLMADELLKDESVRDIAAMVESMQTCLASEDYTEGRTAFMEKRKPAFKGR
jgi:enoyl-CoA hydratase